MKKFWNVLCIDMYRAIGSPKFAAAVFLMVIVELLSCGQMLLRPNDYDVIEQIDNIFAGTGSVDMLVCLFPLIPYALSYAKDEEERAVTYWMIRTKAGTYMTSRFVAACISAFIAVCLSFCITICVLYGMGHPFYHFREYGTAGYYQFLTENRPGLFLAAYVTDRGLGAAIMAGCAVWISSWYPNRYLAFAGPICLFFFALRTVPQIETADGYINAGSWIEDTYNAAQGGAASLLYKIGVTVLVCSIYGLLSVYHVKRRWRRA